MNTQAKFATLFVIAAIIPHMAQAITITYPGNVSSGGSLVVTVTKDVGFESEISRQSGVSSGFSADIGALSDAGIFTVRYFTNSSSRLDVVVAHAQSGGFAIEVFPASSPAPPDATTAELLSRFFTAMLADNAKAFRDASGVVLPTWTSENIVSLSSTGTVCLIAFTPNPIAPTQVLPCVIGTSQLVLDFVSAASLEALGHMSEFTADEKATIKGAIEIIGRIAQFVSILITPDASAFTHAFDLLNAEAASIEDRELRMLVRTAAQFGSKTSTLLSIPR